MSEEVLKSVGSILRDPVERDAVHFALAPVIAAHKMDAGDHVGLNESGEASEEFAPIGIIDPFLTSAVKKGQRCWLFLYPGSIKSLRHEWTHDAFKHPGRTAKDASEAWMRRWAVENMGDDYYDGDGKRPDEDAYSDAIRAGHDLNIGPYESARDSINDEWWGHWENITGCKGQRGEYFSCAC